MKALEQLLIQELTQIRAAESKLEGTYSKLASAPAGQIASFVANLIDLNHRAHRVDKLLDAIATPEGMAV